jgi:uncharacterized protein
MPPTFANGKICYIEMPATDIACSADFYKHVFGWDIRQRGDGSVAFDDGVNKSAALGCFVARLPPHLAFWFTSWLTAWPLPLI